MYLGGTNHKAVSNIRDEAVHVYSNVTEDKNATVRNCAFIQIYIYFTSGRNKTYILTKSPSLSV